jgi:hypothetical protein
MLRVWQGCEVIATGEMGKAGIDLEGGDSLKGNGVIRCDNNLLLRLALLLSSAVAGL